ncbi:poly(R)-hydroxyalkanoic acid synthase subunit PhaE [Croceicoccus hydrothermalis]|uniref:poly(R)-hydroxyalkanoic acid synthase subunit PhaE n=1 Tax=Croceicoccus hydrothermalis TaxID=2867964 RepID=UPI001EFBBA24|nr:poly(R)-hydroxyalkanoic acid synthase subunit PhaE [Croceicoccus hydrothermalis]
MPKPPKSPTVLWQEFVAAWEQEMNDWSTRVTQSEQFSAAMGPATKYSVVAQKAMTEQMEKMLQSMNLPTRSQMQELAERMASLEDGLERLRIAVERDETPAKSIARNEPRRTRKPPAGDASDSAS